MNVNRIEDRRWATRINQEFSVRYRAATMHFRDGRGINIGLTGARLLADRREIEAGPYLQLELDLGEEAPVRVLARRCWSRPVGDGPCVVVGVVFIERGTAARSRIAGWLARRIAEGANRWLTNAA